MSGRVLFMFAGLAVAGLLFKIGLMLIFRKWTIEDGPPGMVYNRKKRRIELVETIIVTSEPRP